MKVPAVIDDITVELIGVRVFETYVDSTSLPHIDMIIVARPANDQSKKYSYPMSEACGDAT